MVRLKGSLNMDKNQHYLLVCFGVRPEAADFAPLFLFGGLPSTQKGLGLSFWVPYSAHVEEFSKLAMGVTIQRITPSVISRS